MSAETIEGESVEIRPDVALTVDRGMTVTGPLALAGLTDEEFDRRLAALDTMRSRVARMQKALMVKDVDYGIIPGTGTKPTLLKPGAEKLCQAYGLAADFAPKRIVGNGLTEPHLSYVTRCELHLGSTDGLTVAVGYGSANSFERKHRYRRGERVCPECGKPTIIKGKDEYGGGWVCFRKKGGCGHKWPDGAAVIEGQTTDDIENPDPFDLDVVLAKMSEKRAFVDATLRATAASGLFTQDVEDLPRTEDPEPPEAPSYADGLIGVVEKGKAPVNLELRQTPDGMAYGFKLKAGNRAFQVLAVGSLGEALSMLEGLEGQRVTVYGSIEMIPWRKGDRDMPPYPRVNLERIQTPDYTLPAPVDVTHGLTEEEKAAIAGSLPDEAPTEPLFPLPSKVAS
jgi:hypothetical protein